MRSKFFREYVLSLIVTVTVTSTVAILAFINKYWTWPNAIVGSVLLLCGIIYLTDRLGIGPSLKSRVRDWLDGSSFSIQTIADTYQFHFVMTDNVGLKTDIWQVKPDGPILIISGKHKASPEQLAAFNAMSKKEQHQFWKTVRMELLRYGISFSDLVLDGDGVALSENVMPSRGFNGTEFLKHVLFVRSGARLYWELLAILYDHGMPQTKAPMSTEERASATSNTPTV